MATINTKYLVTLLMLLLSVRANFLNNDLVFLGFELFLFLSVLKSRLLAKSSSKVVLGFFLLAASFLVCRAFVFSRLPLSYLVSDLLFLGKFILLGFLYSVYMGRLFGKYVVKVITHLSIISLLFYIIQIISNGRWIFFIGRTLESIFPHYDHSKSFTNFLIFSYEERHSFRNSGFAWEPGAFACYLVIALFFALMLNKFRLRRHFIPIVIALLTTLSTTGYLGLMLLCILTYRMKGGSFSFRIIILFLIIGLVIFYTPFLGEKLYNSVFIDNDALSNFDSRASFFEDAGRAVPLGRFSSLIFIYDQFTYDLLLGVSNAYNKVYNSQYNVNLSNGVVDFIAKFGVIGYVVYSYRFIDFCGNYLFKREFLIYAYLVFFVLGFGETILTLPFFLSFLFINQTINNDIYPHPRS